MDTPLPAYSGDDEFVFICYSHRDITQVYEEITSLNELGVNVWYDEGIRPGAEWTDELALAIRRARKLLFFVTPQSVASKHCRDEIQYAIANDVPILVIYLEDTELPPGLSLSLGGVQAVFKQRYDGVRYQRMLVDAISAQPDSMLQPGIYPAHSGIDHALAAKGPPPTPSPRSWRAILMGIAGCMLVAVIILLWWRYTPEPAIQPAASTNPVLSLALLPFEDRGGFEEDRYYPESLSEDLLNRLVAIEGLLVAPRRSSFAFTQQRLREDSFVAIASKLNVSALLTGYIRRQQDRFRIQIELIDVSEGTEVVRWSNSYDNQSAQNIPTIQAEIAQSVAQVFFPEGISAVSQARLAQISTNSPEAYANLLEANEIMRQPIVSSDLIRRAIGLFDEAISNDPNYIWASAGLCSARLRAYQERVGEFSAVQEACEVLEGIGEGLYTVRLALGVYYKESGDLDRALNELSAATELNQRSADVRLELADVLAERSVLNNDPVEKLEAEQAFLEAIKVEPDYWFTYHTFATFLTRLSRLDEAVVQLRKALDIVPTSVASLNNIANILYRQGKTGEAEQYWKKSLSISTDNPFAYSGLGILFHYKREYQTAVDYFLLGTQYAADNHQLWGRMGESYRLIPNKGDEATAAFNKAIEIAMVRAQNNPTHWQTQGYLALYQAYVGNLDAANAHLTATMALNATNEPQVHYWRALVAEQTGDHEEVFTQLELALKHGWSAQKRFIADEPALDTFKATYPDRFADLLARY